MTVMPCVLIVDADPHRRESLRQTLVREGHDVQFADSVAQADICLARRPVAMLLLTPESADHNALIREWRTRSELGIILLDSHCDEARRLASLEHGADEYLCYPLNPRELLSRMRNLMRRVQHAQAFSQPTTHLKRFADWTLDTDRRRLKACDGRETLLSHGEFQLLNVFIRNSGHTLSRDELMEQLRNREWMPNDRSIDVLVGRLRRKLHDDPAEPELIITIHGAGYLFTAGASMAA